jgi:hypothetical protein
MGSGIVLIVSTRELTNPPLRGPLEEDPMVTSRQLRSLMSKNAIDGDVKARNGGWETEVSEKDMKKLTKLGVAFTGVRTGYGSWVLRSSGKEMGEWSDASSRWHY